MIKVSIDLVARESPLPGLQMVALLCPHMEERMGALAFLPLLAMVLIPSLRLYYYDFIYTSQMPYLPKLSQWQ